MRSAPSGMPRFRPGGEIRENAGRNAVSRGNAGETRDLRRPRPRGESSRPCPRTWFENSWTAMNPSHRRRRTSNFSEEFLKRALICLQIASLTTLCVSQLGQTGSDGRKLRGSFPVPFRNPLDIRVDCEFSANEVLVE